MLSFKPPLKKKAFAVSTTSIVAAIIAGLMVRSSTVVAAQEDPTSTMSTFGSSQDPSSYGNVDAFQPTHIEMDYSINFDDRTTYGTVTHTITVLQANQTVVYFDVWDSVDVSKAEYYISSPSPDVVPFEAEEEQEEQGPFVVDDDGYMMVEFEITTPNPNIGNALAVMLPETLPVGTVMYIRFTFMSLPTTTALDWLTPEMTADKTMPFVYSLCQMNFCRDWMPMIDSPSQKITYNATIVAPTEFVVSMSGNETSKVMINETHSATVFECNLKIPSYQIALIVGDLVSQSLSDRVIVFAEPSVIDAAVEEFEDLPEILSIAETYLTPYIWGVYSIFVMPPSFPWGGMEHINANQVSPTLLAGDKSMLGTAIHEITHSWFGNDVGCQNWDNFWINEGLNTWMERKVMEELYGEDYTKIEYYNGNTSMYYGDMLGYYGLDSTYSSLFPDIGDDDPENSFSGVPYDKGAQFAYYIETILGKSGMQSFIRAYIGEFTQMAINSPEMYTFYESWVTENFPENSTEILEMTMWNEWVYVPGLAPGTLDFSTQALEDSIELAEQYILLGGAESPVNFLDYNNYLYSQKLAFVQTISISDDVDANLLGVIDADLDLTSSETNPFVKTEWYIAGIRNGYDAVMDPAYVWLGQQGRHAFVTPTFTALVNDANDCKTAKMWYDDYISTYNSYVQWRVDGVMEACNDDSQIDGGGRDGVGDGEESTAPTEDIPAEEPAPSPTPSGALPLDYYHTFFGFLSTLFLAVTFFS